MKIERNEEKLSGREKTIEEENQSADVGDVMLEENPIRRRNRAAEGRKNISAYNPHRKAAVDASGVAAKLLGRQAHAESGQAQVKRWAKRQRSISARICKRKNMLRAWQGMDRSRAHSRTRVRRGGGYRGFGHRVNLERSTRLARWCRRLVRPLTLHL